MTNANGTISANEGWRQEAKRCVRLFQRYDSAHRADRQASFRLTPGQRAAIGEAFWMHPAIPDRAFRSRKCAALAAIACLNSEEK